MRQRYLLQIPLFSLICVLTGFIFTVPALSVRDARFGALFRENAITALCVGLAAYNGGFWLYHRTGSLPLWARYKKSVLAALVAGLLGRTLAAFLNRWLTGTWPLTGLDLAVSYIPALMMTFLIATGYILYWHYSDAVAATSAPEETLELKADGEIRYVSAQSICYLTAHGKKTIVHTTESDHTVNMLLKDFLQRFRIPGLVRSHKKHAVQTRVIASLKHHRSGEYMASLAGDTFVVPVSPKFLPDIRRAKTI